MAVSSGFSEHFPSFSLFTKGDDSGKMVPAWGCFKRTCFWSFRSIATSSVDRDSPGSNISRKCLLANFVSQCYVGRVSLTVPKHLDSCSSFHMADVTLRALSSHFVSLFYELEPSQAHTPNVESGSPVKMLMLPGGVFLDALLYNQ